MASMYCAFLVRCWRLAAGQQRFEIQEIGSGERTVVASLTAALAWIAAPTDSGTVLGEAEHQAWKTDPSA